MHGHHGLALRVRQPARPLYGPLTATLPRRWLADCSALLGLPCSGDGPTLLYNPSAPGHKKEWYSGYGINNPSILVLDNGTTFLAGRTCSGPEHPWVAKAPSWKGPFASIDHDSQPFPMLNAGKVFALSCFNRVVSRLLLPFHLVALSLEISADLGGGSRGSVHVA